MNKITRDSCSAFIKGREFKRDNTVIRVNDMTARMYLYGNKIAEHNLENGEIIIRDCGWQTVTTKRRLRGIIHFAIGEYNERCKYDGLFQRDYVWHLSKGKDLTHTQWESGWNTLVEAENKDTNQSENFTLAPC